MAKKAETPVISQTLQPADQPALAEAVRQAHQSRTAIYPVGGGTSLGFGMPARQEGIALSLGNLTRIVDYPARDMTITVEAGITMEQLANTLAGQRQWLPIDVPQPQQATLGGVIATNTSGPRRFAHGTIRDYVIGITAVDGRGTPFSGGGRVVKNVAGYDFCKLLCGSLGTLGIVTQVTLKLKPRPAASAFLAAALPDFGTAEAVLARLVHSQTTPTAIEMLSGPAWRDDRALGSLATESAAVLAVGLEGTQTEVDWMLSQLRREWQEQGLNRIHQPPADQTALLWQRLAEFPAAEPAAAVLKMSVVPSQVCGMVELLHEMDPACSLQSHAGNGIVVARMSGLAGGELSAAIVKKLQPAALRGGGSVVVLAAGEGMDATRQVMWGSAGEELRVMQAIKQQFDPLNLLNPGRFVYGAP